MRARIFLWLTALLLFSGAAAAGELETNIALCDGGTNDSDERIVACTWLLDSGRLQPSQLATIYADRGKTRGEKKEFDGAIRDLDEAVRLTPDNAEFYYLRGSLHEQRGNYFEDKVFNYDTMSDHRAISDYHRAISDYDREILDYEHGARLDPNTWRADRYRSFANDAKSYRDAVLQELEQATARARMSKAIGHLERGTANYLSGDFDGAIRELDELVRLGLVLAQAYQIRGGTYRRVGAHDRAIEDLSKAIELGSGKYVAFSYWFRGVAYGDKGDYEREIEDYDAAIERMPNFADAYASRGVAFYQMGETDRGLRDIEKSRWLIRERPSQAVTFPEGDLDDAIRDFDAAIRQRPDDAKAYLSRGNTYRRRGDFDHAVRDLDEAVRLDPGNPFAHFSRGATYDHLFDDAQAIPSYEEAIRLGLNRAVVYNRLAWLYATSRDDSLRDGKKAVRLAKKAIALRDSATHRETLAAAYAEAGRFDEALQEQGRAIDMLRAEDAPEGSIERATARRRDYRDREPQRRL